MNIKINKILKFLLFIGISIAFSLTNTTYATSSISISQSDVSIDKGNSRTITISSTNGTGTIYATSDNSNVSVNLSDNWIENGKSVTLTIEGEHEGNSTISISGVLSDETDSEAKENKISKEINVAVNGNQKENEGQSTQAKSSISTTTESESTPTQPTPAPSTTETKKSNNANLSNLGFTPTDFKGFKPWQTEYSATVKGDVEQVNVYAKAQDSKAKITSGTGTQKLNVGTNSLKVTVTAEDGTTKTYTINVTREQTEENTTEDTNTVNEETTENEEQENKTSDLTKLEVVGFTLTPAFSPDIYEYKLSVNNDVKDLEVKTEGLNENIQIEVAGNKDLVDGENTITILVHNKENNTNQTYQILVNKALESNENIYPTVNNAVKKANIIRTIFIGVVILIILAIIIFFIIKHKNDIEKNDKYEYDDEDSETLDLDEEEELFKRVDKKEFLKKVNDNDEINSNKKVRNEEIKVQKKATFKNSINEEEFDDEYGEDDDEMNNYFGTLKDKRKGKHF